LVKLLNERGQTDSGKHAFPLALDGVAKVASVATGQAAEFQRRWRFPFDAGREQAAPDPCRIDLGKAKPL
jgi:hypothetical protein